MRHFCYIVVLLSFANSPCYAQQLNRFSVKTGLAISQQSYNNRLYSFNNTHQPKHHLNTWFVGAQYLQPILGKSNITIDAQLVEKGFKTEFASTSGNTIYNQSYEYEMDYVEIQLNYNYKFKIKKINRDASLIAGFVGSYLARASQVFNEVDYKQSSQRIFVSNFAQDYTDRFYRWDFGMNYGVKMNVIKNIDVEVTLQKHLVRADRLKQFEVMYNQVILFGIRYSFL